jgi:hypothetical protein
MRIWCIKIVNVLVLHCILLREMGQLTNKATSKGLGVRNMHIIRVQIILDSWQRISNDLVCCSSNLNIRFDIQHVLELSVLSLISLSLKHKFSQIETYRAEKFYFERVKRFVFCFVLFFLLEKVGNFSDYVAFFFGFCLFVSFFFV